MKTSTNVFTIDKQVEGYRDAGSHRIPDHVAITMKECLTIKGEECHLLEVTEGGNLILSYEDSKRDVVLSQFWNQIRLYDKRGYSFEQVK